MAKATKAIEAIGYVAPRGNKALGKASTAKAIAAQHAAFATKQSAGVPMVDYALRVMAVGGDLRFAGWGTPDASYSVATTRYVHTYRHTTSLPKGTALACDGLHAGGEACSATSKNIGIDVRTYRNDSAPELAKVLDSDASLIEAASTYFGIALRNGIAQGYNDAARLLATAGIAQLLQHPRAGAAMRKAFDAATKAPAPRKARAPKVAMVASEPTGVRTEQFVRTEAEQAEAEQAEAEATE